MGLCPGVFPRWGYVRLPYLVGGKKGTGSYAYDCIREILPIKMIPNMYIKYTFIVKTIDEIG